MEPLPLEEPTTGAISDESVNIVREIVVKFDEDRRSIVRFIARIIGQVQGSNLIPQEILDSARDELHKIIYWDVNQNMVEFYKILERENSSAFTDELKALDYYANARDYEIPRNDMDSMQFLESLYDNYHPEWTRLLANQVYQDQRIPEEDAVTLYGYLAFDLDNYPIADYNTATGLFADYLHLFHGEDFTLTEEIPRTEQIQPDLLTRPQEEQSYREPVESSPVPRVESTRETRVRSTSPPRSTSPSRPTSPPRIELPSSVSTTPTKPTEKMSKTIPEIRQLFSTTNKSILDTIRDNISIIKEKKSSDEDIENAKEVLIQLTEANPNYIEIEIAKMLGEIRRPPNYIIEILNHLQDRAERNRRDNLPIIRPEEVTDSNLIDMISQYSIEYQIEILSNLLAFKVRASTKKALQEYRELVKELYEDKSTQETLRYVTKVKDIVLDPYTDETPYDLNPQIIVYEYQKKAIKWMKDIIATGYKIPGGILNAATGIGKTLIALSVAKYYKDSQFDFQYVSRGVLKSTTIRCKTLITTSANLLTDVAAQAEKFFGGNLRVGIFHDKLSGTESGISAKEINTFSINHLQKYDVILISRDTMSSIAHYGDNMIEIPRKGRAVKATRYIPYDIQVDGKSEKIIYSKRRMDDFTGGSRSLNPEVVGRDFIFTYPWFLVIHDEAHNMVNRETNLWKAAMALPSYNTFCMSATAYRNEIADIFSLYRICGAEIIDERMSVLEDLKPNYLKITKYDQRKEVDIPKIISKIYFINYENEEREVDHEFRERLRGTITLYENKEELFGVILATMTKLRQIALSPFLLQPDDYRPDITGLERLNQIALSPKIEYVMNTLIPRYPGDSFIIFSGFTDVLHACHLWIRDYSAVITSKVSQKQRDKIIDDFRNGDIKVLLMSTGIGGEGLTLIEANHVFIMDPWWNTTTGDQAKGRIERFGQKKQPYIHYLVRRGSVEETMMKIAINKDNIRLKLLNSGKVIPSGKTLNVDTIKELINYD